MSDLSEEAREDLADSQRKGIRLEFGWLFSVKLLSSFLDRIRACLVNLRRGS
jgi:hypothetical protein